MGRNIWRNAVRLILQLPWLRLIRLLLGRYRVVDAVDRLNETEKGLVRIGVINKVSVNLVSACGYVAPATLKRDQQIDEESLNLIGNSKFVLVAESWSRFFGLRDLIWN